MGPTDFRKRALLLAAGLATLGVRAQPAPRTIQMVAKKFAFTPETLTLKRGQPVVLELTTLDVPMGFNADDFHARADIVPGRTATLRFTPDRSGTFSFRCDVFCGSGHEEMGGTIVVTD